VGNEKGGSGKSTTAMHLIVGLLQTGKRVASIDLDVRQCSLSRYIANRRAYSNAIGKDLAISEHFSGPSVTGDDLANITEQSIERAKLLIDGARINHDAVVIDTPGSESVLSRLAHSMSDTLVTPVNDSFIDLDVLGHIDARNKSVVGPSQYSEMVLDQQLQRRKNDVPTVDWIVLRNRIGSLDSHNARDIEWALSEMSGKIGFRVVPGFSERVIFRELFLVGLTILDLKEAASGAPLSSSHKAARKEVLSLIESIFSSKKQSQSVPMTA
ncbi:MAG: AAA family ATPase, partial [Rhodospirillales bacterium]|nr:AAA family ATPase [Rhodospirillales bacterium]